MMMSQMSIWLEVYYTISDTGGLGADGLTVTIIQFLASYPCSQASPSEFSVFLQVEPHHASFSPIQSNMSFHAYGDDHTEVFQNTNGY